MRLSSLIVVQLNGFLGTGRGKMVARLKLSSRKIIVSSPNESWLVKTQLEGAANKLVAIIKPR